MIGAGVSVPNLLAAAAAAALPFAVVDFEMSTASGTFDITASRLGGITPKLALFIVGGHRASEDPGNSGHVYLSIGACDGTNEAFTSSSMQSEVSTTDSYRRIDNGWCIYLIDMVGSSEAIAEFDSFIENGVRLNNVVVPPLAYKGICILFGGDDVDAAVGILNQGAAAGDLSVTGLSFEPNLLMMSAGGDTISSAVDDGNMMHFGFASGPSEQHSITIAGKDADASGATRVMVDTAKILTRLSGFSGTQLWDVSLKSFNSDGFTTTVNASASSQDTMYVALRLDGGSLKVMGIDTPTATGAQAFTGFGFQPDMIIGAVTTQETTDPAGTVAASTTLGGGSGFFAFDATEQWAASYSHSDDGLTVCKSDLKAAALRLGDGTDAGTGAINADLDSFDADGFTLDFDAVESNVKKGFVVGFKAP